MTEKLGQLFSQVSHVGLTFAAVSIFVKGVTSGDTSAVAAILKCSDGSRVWYSRKLNGAVDSFTAELIAVFRALQLASMHAAKQVSLFSNSETAVDLLNEDKQSRKSKTATRVQDCWDQEKNFSRGVKYEFTPLSECSETGMFAQTTELARRALHD